MLARCHSALGHGRRRPCASVARPRYRQSGAQGRGRQRDDHGPQSRQGTSGGRRAGARGRAAPGAHGRHRQDHEDRRLRFPVHRHGAQLDVDRPRRRRSASPPRTPASRRSCGCRGSSVFMRPGRSTPARRASSCPTSTGRARRAHGRQLPLSADRPSLGDRRPAAARLREPIPLAEATAAINDATLLILMIETPEAIDNVDAIAAVPGFDVLLVGANDLCIEMGIPGQLDHPRMVAAFERIVAACRAHGKYAGPRRRVRPGADAALSGHGLSPGARRQRSDLHARRREGARRGGPRDESRLTGCGGSQPRSLQSPSLPGAGCACEAARDGRPTPTGRDTSAARQRHGHRRAPKSARPR